MSSKTPTIRQTAWVSLVPQFLFMGLLFLLFDVFFQKDAILYTALTYLLLSFSLRNFVPKSHRKGISLFNEKKYLEGIESFKKSYGFFKQYEYLDTYRFIVLLSSSGISYREMALNNIAFGYSQIGEGEKSKEFYEKTLLEFPSSEIAKSALNMIKSFGENKNV